VAVVAAVATAVIGVKLSSTELNLNSVPDCPTGQDCAAIAPPKSGGDAAAGKDSGDPAASAPSSGESSPRSSKSPKPSPSAGRTPDRRTPVASARPTPDRTRATPTPKPSRTARNTPEPTPSEDDTEIATPEATPESDETNPVVSPGRVAVDFGVADVTGNGYTGRLTITNSGPTLARWSVRMPVGGDVTEADGAEWTQQGDVLVLSSTRALGQNDQVMISFTADGDSTLPQSCELSGGDCRIRATEDIAPEAPSNF
jgi:hypothetical protein